MERTLTKALENPILPRTLVDLLTEYRETAVSNQRGLLFLLDSSTREMPQEYSSLEDLDAYPVRMHHQFIVDFHDLKLVADRIVEFMRSYFDAENLTRP